MAGRDGSPDQRLTPAGADYYVQYVCAVTQGGMGAEYLEGLPWDTFLKRVETAMRLDSDRQGLRQ